MKQEVIEILKRFKKDLDDCADFMNCILAIDPPQGKTHLDVLCDRLNEAREKIREKSKD